MSRHIATYRVVSVKCFLGMLGRMPLSREQQKQLVALGANVRRLRIAAEVSQAELAERAELALRNIQRIEAGELNILFTTLVRIKAALQTEWPELLRQTSR